MSAIAEFLRARYIEAKERQQRIFRDTYEPGAPCPICTRPTWGMRMYGGDESRLASFEPCGHDTNDPAVVAQFQEPAPDPDVIADLDAKLALIDDLPAERHQVVEDCWWTCAAATEERDGGETCHDARIGSPCDCGRDARVNRRLAILAQPFAGHPDHKGEKWAP